MIFPTAKVLAFSHARVAAAALAAGRPVVLVGE